MRVPSRMLLICAAPQAISRVPGIVLNHEVAEFVLMR